MAPKKKRKVNSGKYANKVTRAHRRRGYCVFCLIIGFMITLLARLYSIQVFEHNYFRTQAEKQHGVHIQLLPRRGIICDRNGKELAISTTVNSFFVRPDEVGEVSVAASKLAPLLNMSKGTVYQKLTDDASFVWLKRQMEKDETVEIMKLNLKGIGVLEESRRFYPKGKLAGNLLGFVGVDNEGLEGIELYYDQYLRGTPGRYYTERDAYQKEIVISRDNYIPARDGFSLILTVDEVIQYITERELEKGFKNSSARGAIAVVMQPQTGEILALACLPTFDPNRFNKYPASYRRNRSITDVFEPGSTFKVITAAGALDRGLFNPGDKIYCENGSFRLAGHVIHDHHPYEELTFRETVEKSSNIGLVKIGLRLGPQNLHHYITAFGFGRHTGVDLPGEVSGLLRPVSRWSRLSMGAIPFGQEVAVNSLQLVNAFSAIANQGTLMQPYIVKAIIDSEGRKIKVITPSVKKQVISAQTASILTDIMVGVVENGTARRAAIPGYRVAGKTGTAQKVEPSGGYSHSRYVSSFAGYVPAENPQIAVLVVFDEPQGKMHQKYGGYVAAPVFRRIAQETLHYLKIPPHSDKGKVVQEDNSDKSRAANSSNDSGNMGKTGKTTLVFGSSFSPVDLVQRIGASRVTMPAVYGLSKRQVVRMLAPYSLQADFDGAGIVLEQFPLPGTEIRPGDKCIITFAPPRVTSRQ